MGFNPFVSKSVDHYLTEIISRESPVQRRLREETQKMPMRIMQTSPDQVAFLAMLVRMLNAKNILEIGTFTGYSALAMANALPQNGKLIALDISKEWTDVAKRYWQEAGVANRIELRLGDAKASLAELAKENMFFDLVFIDADKTAYDAYYEACLKLIPPGGVIAFDNMLWNGAVADPTIRDPDTNALRSLNAKIRDDARVDACLLSIADGIMLICKK
jgi:predicted O-methyltransferase YrrM